MHASKKLLQPTSISAGYVETCKVDAAQKNWFEAGNNCLKTNHAAPMQITMRMKFIVSCNLKKS